MSILASLRPAKSLADMASAGQAAPQQNSLRGLLIGQGSGRDKGGLEQLGIKAAQAAQEAQAAEQAQYQRDRQMADPLEKYLDPSIVERGNMPWSPWGATKEGEVKIAVPESVLSLARSLMLPGRVAQGYNPTPEEITRMAMDTGMAGGFSSAIGGVPENSLGMFLTTIRPSSWAVKSGDKSMRVFRNPTKEELVEQTNGGKTLRVLKYSDGTIDTWPADKMLHGEMAQELISRGKVSEKQLKNVESLFYDADTGFYSQ